MKMKIPKIMILLTTAVTIAITLNGCDKSSKGNWSGQDTIPLLTCPVFCSDSAYDHIQTQCAFGPRVTGTTQSEACAKWIQQKFALYGCRVTSQKITVTTWDGAQLPCNNIIASTNPDKQDRILICTHWDSRPWADNDDDERNHHTPVPAANDGASGVGVMIEIARAITQQPLKTFGIDFICFDAEDMGTPQWAESDGSDTQSTWCLGSEAWSHQAVVNGYTARYGILLDMVGGRGATFAKEQVSLRYARPIVELVWALASQIGYSSYFPNRDGGALIDDHVNVNTIAGIPCIDIVPNYTDGPSSFGPTWHTITDTPENIDPNTLEAVGQTLIQLIYNDDK